MKKFLFMLMVFLTVVQADESIDSKGNKHKTSLMEIASKLKKDYSLVLRKRDKNYKLEIFNNLKYSVKTLSVDYIDGKAVFNQKFQDQKYREIYKTLSFSEREEVVTDLFLKSRDSAELKSQLRELVSDNNLSYFFIFTGFEELKEKVTLVKDFHYATFTQVFLKIYYTGQFIFIDDVNIEKITPEFIYINVKNDFIETKIKYSYSKTANEITIKNGYLLTNEKEYLFYDSK